MAFTHLTGSQINKSFKNVSLEHHFSFIVAIISHILAFEFPVERSALSLAIAHCELSLLWSPLSSLQPLLYFLFSSVWIYECVNVCMWMCACVLYMCDTLVKDSIMLWILSGMHRIWGDYDEDISGPQSSRPITRLLFLLFLSIWSIRCIYACVYVCIWGISWNYVLSSLCRERIWVAISLSKAFLWFSLASSSEIANWTIISSAVAPFPVVSRLIFSPQLCLILSSSDTEFLLSFRC